MKPEFQSRLAVIPLAFALYASAGGVGASPAEPLGCEANPLCRADSSACAITPLFDPVHPADSHLAAAAERLSERFESFDFPELVLTLTKQLQAPLDTAESSNALIVARAYAPAPQFLAPWIADVTPVGHEHQGYLVKAAYSSSGMAAFNLISDTVPQASLQWVAPSVSHAAQNDSDWPVSTFDLPPALNAEAPVESSPEILLQLEPDPGAAIEAPTLLAAAEPVTQVDVAPEAPSAPVSEQTIASPPAEASSTPPEPEPDVSPAFWNAIGLGARNLAQRPLPVQAPTPDAALAVPVQSTEQEKAPSAAQVAPVPQDAPVMLSQASSSPPAPEPSPAPAPAPMAAPEPPKILAQLAQPQPPEPTPTRETWRLPPMVSLKQTLMEWSVRAGWIINWDVPTDFEPAVANEFTGSFEDAVIALFNAFPASVSIRAELRTGNVPPLLFITQSRRPLQ